MKLIKPAVCLAPIVLAALIKAQDGPDGDGDYFYTGDDETDNEAELETYADDNGIAALVIMIRTMICRVFHPTRSLRKCPARIGEVENAIRNYGCNCLPENFDDIPYGSINQPSYHMGKNGRPIDDVDAACTRLRDAYTCIVFDTEDSIFEHPDSASSFEGDKCGRFTQYDYHINGDKEIICGPEDNPEYAAGNADEECKRAVCDMERQFAAEVYTLIGSDPEQFAIDNADNYGIHSDATQCVLTNNGHGVSECCGDYPLRHPFIPFIKTCCDIGGGTFEATLIGEC